MHKLILFTFLILLGGCQSVQEKNMALVNDRSDNLRFLTRWRPTWCRVETKLTSPAIARYTQMFPSESAKLGEPRWSYTWKARKDSCEVTPLSASPLSENHKAFLNEAMCVLLQVHWVNSPFADLEIVPDEVVRQDDRVQIRVTPNDPHLGVYLNREIFELETKTKSRGNLRVLYGILDGEWLPVSLEQILGKSHILVDQIDYDNRRMNGRRMIKSLWISVGDEKPLQHTFVEVSECQNY